MKKKWTKRSISFLLVLALLVQLLPAMALGGSADKLEPEDAPVTSAEPEDAYVVGEAEELREESVKHFRMSDGSFLAVEYQTPVHYENADGTWSEIDNTLTRSGDQYVTRSGLMSRTFSASLSSGRLFETQYQDYKVGMSLVTRTAGEPAPVPTPTPTLEIAEATPGLETDAEAALQEAEREEAAEPETAVEPAAAAQAAAAEEKITAEETPAVQYSPMQLPGVKASVENPESVQRVSGKTSTEKMLAVDKLTSSVRFANALENTDLIYRNYGYNVKESVVIKRQQEAYVYAFGLHLTCLTPTLEEDGSVLLANADGEAIFCIPAPYLEDAAGMTSPAAEYSLAEQDGDYVLTVTADPAWLNAADRAFPVVLDPTIMLHNKGKLKTTYIRSAWPDARARNSADQYCGFINEDEYHVCEICVQTESLPKLPANCIPVSAQITMCHLGFFASDAFGSAIAPSGSLTVEAHEWKGTIDNIADLTWWGVYRDSPGVDDTVLDYQVLSKSTLGSYVSWDVTPVAMKWLTNGTQKGSIILKSVNNDTQQRVANLIGHGYLDRSPYFIIQYRSTAGLEDYYTYQAMQAGNAGTAYVSDYTGQLTVSTPVVAFASSSNPFSLDLIYNSTYFKSSGAAYNACSGMHMNVGSGMRLNVLETVEKESIEDVPYLKYTDGDGTVHYFANDTSKDSTKKYFYDEDGLGLKMTEYSTNDYEMSDDHGNKRIFPNGYLGILEDSNGNKYNIHYTRGDGDTSSWYACGSGDRISGIYQKNKGATAETRVAAFTYAADNTLTSISDYSGVTYTFGYNSQNLTQIKRNGTTIAEFSYENRRMTQLTDAESKAGISVQYSGGKVSSYEEIAYANGAAQYGNQVQVQYPDDSQTCYRYHKGGEPDAANDTLTYYSFDYAGRTVNAYTTDSAGKLLGASNAAYTGYSSTSKTNNRTQRAAAIGVAAQAEMRNGGFENTASDVAWTLIGAGTSSTNAVIKNTDIQTRTGNYAWKGWVQNGKSGIVGASGVTYQLQSGYTYTVSAYVNTTEVSSFLNDSSGVYLEIRDSSGNGAVSERLNYKTSSATDGGWMRISLTYQTKTKAVHTITIKSEGVCGILYVDDVQVENAAVPSNKNLLENGNLEYWGYGWSNNGTSFVTGCGRHSTSPYAYSIHAAGGAQKICEASQTVNINLPGTETYVLSGWAKGSAVPDPSGSAISGAGAVPSTDKRFGLRAEVKYTDGTTEYHYVPFSAALQDWQFVSTAIVPKSASKTVSTIKVVCEYDKNANEAYFDELSLVREVAQTMKYDSEGNLTSVASTGNKANEDTFSSGKLIKTVTGGNGTYTYSYGDTAHPYQITKITDSVVQESFTYDTAGNVERESYGAASGGRQIVQDNTYSNNGNRISTATVHGSFADGSTEATTTYIYDGPIFTKLGLPSETKTAANVTYGNRYDEISGRPLMSYLSNTVSLDYTYNAGGWLDRIARGGYNWNNGGTGVKTSQYYRFLYDAFGNQTEIRVTGEDAAAGYVLGSYDYGANNGSLQRFTYGNGTAVDYLYDNLDRVTSKTTTTGDSTRSVSYLYTGDGQLGEQRDGSGEERRYSYDGVGRLSGMQKTGLAHPLNTGYQYDTSNRLTKRTYAIPGVIDTAEETLYYRAATGEGRPAGTLGSMALFSNSWLYYDYDAQLRVSGRKVGNILRESYAYQDGAAGYTTTMVRAMAVRDFHQEGSTGTPLHRWEYAYDKLGNIQRVKDTVTNQTTEYSYDKQSQLTKAVTPGKTYTYTYDTSGNLLKATAGSASHTYTYGDENWRDLLTAYDGQTIGYDAIGNPTSYYNGRRYTFTWSEGRRLTESAVSGKTTSYAYDADGLRTRKTNADGTYSDYYWADGLLLSEQKCSASGAQLYKLRFLYDEKDAPVGVSYKTGAGNSGWTSYYFAKNLQGDVVALYHSNYINETTYQQSLEALYEYDPWGNVTVKTPGGAVNTSASFIGNINPLRYRGYYYDSESGFYYLQSRYYDPQIGRFINADNQLKLDSELTGMNLFAYCGNNPVNGIDPTGEAWWHWALGAAIVAACAVATVVTCGGFAAAATAVGMVGCGMAAATTASTVAASAFIGSASIYGAAAFSAAINSNSVKDFNRQGNWRTVAVTAGGAVLGGASAYIAAKGSSPSLSTNRRTSHGSTGRTESVNLREQLAMEQVQSNPMAGTPLKRVVLNDPRWPASEGWVKMQQIVPTSQGNINIHYVYNQSLKLFDDFKFNP